MKLFLIGFAQLFLSVQNHRNAAQSRYIPFFFVSLAISVLLALSVKEVVRADFFSLCLYSLGSALGGVMGIWVHKRLTEPKDPRRW